MKRSMMLGGLFAVFFAVAPMSAEAQQKGERATPVTKSWTRNAAKVPAGHWPPRGMCRIWIDGVPPGRQPAPTDCATAVRNKPANARVIYGDDNPRYRKSSRDVRGERDDDDGDDDDEDRRRPRDRDRERDDDDDDDEDDDDRYENDRKDRRDSVERARANAKRRAAAIAKKREMERRRRDSARKP